MGYLGQSILPFNPLATSGKPRDAQRFNGDNSTTTFTLNYRVDNPTDLEVFVENVQQEPLTAYDAIGSQLIFTEAPPSGTNNVYVIYRNIEPGVYASIPDGAVTFNKLANNIRLFTTDNFTGDNTTVAFGLSSEVPDANTLMVTVDGVFQRAPIHYTATGNTITFTSAPPSSSNVHVRHLGFRTTQSITALPANTTISQPTLQNPQITSQAVFAAGSNTAPSITAAGDTNTGIYFPAADTIAFTEGGLESARIDSAGSFYVGKANNSTAADGFVVFKSGETRISCTANDVLNLNRNTSNGAVQRFFRDGSFVGQIEASTTGLTYTGVHGITFTATQNASADANTLDDYEEGTWTPVLSTTGTNFSSVSYNTGNTRGTYTKIGDTVFFRGVLLTTGVTVGSASGTVQISGLPFASQSVAERPAVALAEQGQYGGWNTTPISGSISSGASSFLFNKLASLGGSQSNLAPADVGTGGTGNFVMFSGQYKIA